LVEITALVKEIQAFFQTLHIFYLGKIFATSCLIEMEQSFDDQRLNKVSNTQKWKVEEYTATVSPFEAVKSVG